MSLKDGASIRRIELRRGHLVVLNGRGDVLARIGRVGKKKHPAYDALEEWHRKRWGEVCTGDVFEGHAHEVVGFIAAADALRDRFLFCVDGSLCVGSDAGCGAERGGAVCARNEGHGGVHIACGADRRGTDVHNVAVWS